MNQPELPRVKPPRCEGKFNDAMWADPNWIAEEKLDGSRYVLHIDYDGLCRLYSRRDFPRIEKAANVPHITGRRPELTALGTVMDPRLLRPYPGFEGTVLDGEIKLPGSTFLSETTGIMNMLPANAIAEQGRVGLLHFTVFDMPFMRGIDMRPYKYRDRRVQLIGLLRMINNPHISVVSAWQADKRAFYDQVLSRGGEGIVLKHINSCYGENWVKRKKYTDVSVFVTDFQRGRPSKVVGTAVGKYEHTLGALIVSVYDGDRLYEMGRCSGMDDATRDAVWANRDAYMFKVCDVRAQEVSPHGRLREPRFLRWRDDLDIRECTLDNVKRAFKVHASSEEAA